MRKPPTDADAGYIWATRGQSWGFRFIRRGGLADPLRVYEDAFSNVGDLPEAWHRVADKEAALRFPDPDGRRDLAGRVIPHDFVLLGPWAEGVDSLEEARQRMWREVADEFERIWNEAEPPSTRE